MSSIFAFAVSVPLSKKSLVVRTLASLLIIALLAPATISLRAKAEAKERAGVSSSAATTTGNLAAPEPMTFPVIAAHAGKSRVLHGLGEQWQQLQAAHSSVIKWAVSAFSRVSLLGAVTTGAAAKGTVATSPNTASTSATAANNASISSSASLPPTATTAYDFDGDDKADIAFWRPSDGTWWVLQSSTQELTMRQWGAAGDRIVPADYDGDGKTDYGVYTPSSGMWNVLLSSNGQVLVNQWGTGNDVPIASDFDGDGRADIAVWRPSTGVWYIVKSSDNSWYAVSFGGEQFGDIPVAGDYDGDGKADVAVWRASNGVWYIQQSSNGFAYYSFGSPGDIPVPADYDGDGKIDYAVWRPSTNVWIIFNSADGAVSYAELGLNAAQDVLVPADYDGDGKADIAVWRPSSGTWYIWRSSNSALWYTSFGISGDIPVPAAYIKQPGATPTPTTTSTTVSREALAAQRLAPLNATGGTNLYSRNFSWESGLVGLPGRAGLDAGLSLSYNSLVWTKVGNTMVFDADKADITPGFRFGFPTIEPVYTDLRTNKLTYLMVTPSGGRAELRQTATSNLYESADSSYLQLEVIGTGSQEQRQLVVRTTGGTQMKYVWKAGAYRCAEMKDSNGNYITVNHDSAGLLRSIKDTLGRVIAVNYDSTPDPVSITQTLTGGTTHTWATFSYATKTINYNFGSLAVSGPVNNTTLKVLDKVTFIDGGYNQFEYNSYGQVWRVNSHAADGHKLNHTAVNLAIDLDNSAPDTSAQTDCPRFSETRSYAENFNGGAEVIIDNDLRRGHQVENSDGATVTASLIQVSMRDHPNGNITNNYVGESGWMESLPIRTNDYANGNGLELKRSSWTKWEQDDTTLSYIKNPRVVETKVGDSGSTRKTTINYHSQFGLAHEVREYDSNGTTVLRKTATDYNLGSAYTSRRIIGLPSERKLYEGESTLMSKVTFAYDGGGFTEAGQNISPVQQDAANYGAGFIAGRGNLTSTTRWDATAPTDAAKAVTSSVKYNTTGSPVSSSDPAGRTTGVSYDDKFVNNQYGDETSRNTFAYPTTLTDAAGYSSTIKYRFDFGATMEAQSPPADGQTQGRTTKRKYDSYGRLERVTTVNNEAYTRYVYANSQGIVQTYSTLVNVNEPDNPNDDGVGAEDEVKSETYFDGYGRTRATLTEHPGSAGGFTGQLVEYDSMGRVKRQSMPTEVNAAFGLMGDGAARGWLWTSQDYDWKGRVIKTTNTDNTFSQASYEGCGCAGGEKVTVEGESVPDGLGGQSKRKQRSHSDILGRQYKTEVLNWDGTVYSTTVTKLNGRDQTLWVKQYVGEAPATALDDESCPTGTCQMTKMTYDGHGRMASQHRPQQDADKATVYEYYENDEVRKTTDARGATATYTYNNRGLVTNINHSMPATPTQSTQSFSSSSLTGGSPIGHLDGVDGGTWKATGWSFDPDNPSASNNVDIYIDGPAGTGTGLARVVADKSRPDINNTFGIEGNHGFEFTIPNQYLDGNQHTLYAYGIDTGGDYPKLLGGSPQSFVFSPNAVQPTLNSSVEFNYDAAGNRLWMTDNLGRTDYVYDGLSRLKEETRKFTDTTQNGSPLVMGNMPNNSFKLQYSYGLANQLTSLTDPYGEVINYGYDPAGRLKNVTGSSFGGVTNYARDAEYQAWGALKQLTYADNLQMTMTYNNRLQAASYTLAGGASGQVMSKNYQYYADGALRYVQDALDPKFDRLNNYNHLGRIKEGKSGLEARGTEVTNVEEQKTSLPYRQSYQFNAFGNLTQRNNRHWGVDYWQGQSNNLSYEYKDDRIQGAGWHYDADGRNLQTAAPDDYATSRYNAAGQMVRSTTEQTDAVRWYDGNGREIKRRTANQTENSSGQISWQMKTKYYVRSSILSNEVVSEVWSNGKKAKTFVRAAGSQLAYQAAHASEAAALNEAVIFEYSDASGMSQRTTDKTGASVATGDGGDGSPVELDPMGNNVGTSTPYIEQPVIPYEPQPQYPMLEPWNEDQPMMINGQRISCTVDGMATSCSSAFGMLRSGSAVPADIEQFRNTMFGLGLGGSTVEVPGDNSGGGDFCQNGVCPDVLTVTAAQSTFIFIPEFSTVSWNPRQMIQPPSSPEVGNDIGSFGRNGGGNRNRGNYNQKNLESAIDSCAKDMFGVTLTNFQPTQKGQNGSAVFRLLDRNNSRINTEGFAIVNSLYFSAADLKIFHGAQVDGLTFYDRSPVDGVTPRYGIYSWDSKPITLSNGTRRSYRLATNINYTAHDLRGGAGRNGVSGFITTQIHEIGNSLQLVTGRDYKPVPGAADNDAGLPFENCVFKEYNKLQRTR